MIGANAALIHPKKPIFLLCWSIIFIYYVVCKMVAICLFINLKGFATQLPATSVKNPKWPLCANMVIITIMFISPSDIFTVQSVIHRGRFVQPSSVNGSQVQYIPRNMHTVFALLCFVVVIHWLIFPYPPGLHRCHCGNLTIAPVPAKQPWWIWINTSCEIIMNDNITTTKQSTTEPCAYSLEYTVHH